MLSKEDSKKIKGIAIILMLIHHLYAFPDRMPYGLNVSTSVYISGQELTVVLGSFGAICISLYMFLGGYGLYSSCVFHDKENVQVKNILYRKIVTLYFAYWKVFLIFIPIGFVFFSNQNQYCELFDLCTRFADYSFQTIITDFFGITCFFNHEWWFLKTYFFTLFEGFIFIEIFRNKKSIYLECGAIVLWNILIAQIFPSLASISSFAGLNSNIWYVNIFMISEYALSFFVGIIFAKYNVFVSWKQIFKSQRRIEKILLSLLAVCFIIYLRVFILPVPFDMLLVPIFVIACNTFIEEFRFLNRILMVLGKHSTNMWLIHSFYCYYFYFFVKMVYTSQNAIVAVLILTFLSLGSSILINKFWETIGRIYFKLSAKAKMEVI